MGKNKLLRSKYLKKRCEICGTKYDLTIHHQWKDRKFVPRTYCASCHYFIDFKKNMACYTKSKYKEYQYQMDKYEMLLRKEKAKHL